MDSLLQGNVSGLTNWEPQLCAGVYIYFSLFHEVLVALVLNPETVHISPQFYVVFYNEFPTFPFMREVTIPLNWTDLVQHISKGGALENIYIRGTWIAPDF